jgi:sugar lactone lactonase YvrE
MARGISHFSGLILVLFLCLPQPARLQAQESYTISTLSGAGSDPSGYTGDGGPATQARLNRPGGLALGLDGTLYISDTGNGVVRAVEPSGRIRTVAGTATGGRDGDGIPATQAKLDPGEIALDSKGNLYIVEERNARIRRVNTSGVIETFAGTGQRGSDGDGGLATKATLSRPKAIVIDRDDVVYFTARNEALPQDDEMNFLIRKVAPDGTITRVAFIPGGRSYDSQTPFASPEGLVLESPETFYVTYPGQQRIVKVAPDGTVSVFAGAKGPGRFQRDAVLPWPGAIASDKSGNLLVATDYRIRLVDKNGAVTTLLGTEPRPPGPEVYEPPKASIEFNPGALLLDRSGVLYIADTLRHRVLRKDPPGGLTVVAGFDLPPETEGGPAELARHLYPRGVTVSPYGEIFIADTGMNRICRITQDGRVFTVAGKGVRSIYQIFPPPGDGLRPRSEFSGDGGQATQADLSWPNSVAVDASGTLYIADTFNNRIRKVTSLGIISTIAGTGEYGFGGDGGPAVAAALRHPRGLAVDDSGNIFVADSGNNRIRQLTRDGKIKTLIGSWEPKAVGDGAAPSVRLDDPRGVALRNGVLYVADTGDRRVRKLGRDGIVRTVAGSNSEEPGDGGPARKASLVAPFSLAVDAAGSIYVADGSRIRKITRDGIIHTIAGLGESGVFSGDGGPALRTPLWLAGIAVDKQGNVYITDESRIRVLSPAHFGAGHKQ